MTGRVWNSTVSYFTFERACGVRNLTRACLWNLATDGVRNLLVANLRHHSRAADLLLNGTWNPSLAADGFAGARTADDLRTAWITWVRNTLPDHRAGDCLRVRLPPTAADRHGFCFRNRLHDRVAAVFPACLRFRAVRCVALVTVAGVVARSTDFVAARAITRLKARFANRITDVSIACLVTRFSYWYRDSLPAGVNHRLADFVRHTTVVSFVHRSADGVTLRSIARLVDVSSTGNRNGFDAAVVDDSIRRVLLLIPNDFSYRPVLDAAATLRRSEVST